MPPGRIRPGKVWSYSNTNYLLLGELVKAVTGRPLAKEVRDRLLDPLDLRTAWYQAVEKPKTELTTGYRLVPLASGGARAVPVAPASDVMPFRSVVTAAGRRGVDRRDGGGHRALDAGLRRRQGPVTGDADRDARRRAPTPARSTRASRTASGSRS